MFSRRVEKTVGKGEIACYEQFLLFIQCFQKTYTTDTLKPGLVWERVNATLTAKIISWQSVRHMFPGFLTPVLAQLFFPKPPTTFLTCFCRGKRQKYPIKKVHLNRGLNLKSPGYESDMLTTEPPGWIILVKDTCYVSVLCFLVRTT